MNDNMWCLVCISMIAIYVQRGITYAVAYGVSQGLTSDQVLGFITHYENQRANAAQGLLP